MKFEETIINENDHEGGWVDTYISNDNKDSTLEVDLADDIDECLEAGTSNAPVVDNLEDDDSDAEDIENYTELDDENDQVWSGWFREANLIYFSCLECPRCYQIDV